MDTGIPRARRVCVTTQHFFDLVVQDAFWADLLKPLDSEDGPPAVPPGLREPSSI